LTANTVSWAAWQQFLHGLVTRGLSGVQLVTSDAHRGLKTAIATILQGAGWQRCRRPLRTQRPCARAEECPVARGGNDPYRVCATRRGECAGTMATGGRWLSPPLPATGNIARRGRSGSVGLHSVSRRSLTASVEQQSARAAEQGGEAACRCGRYLPQRGCSTPARGGGAGGTARRVASEPMRLQCRVAGNRPRADRTRRVACHAMIRLFDLSMEPHRPFYTLDGTPTSDGGKDSSGRRGSDILFLVGVIRRTGGCVVMLARYFCPPKPYYCYRPAQDEESVRLVMRSKSFRLFVTSVSL